MDNKKRLFEMMKKINPDFRINEVELVGNNNFQHNQTDGENYRLETYGDLKKIINVIKQNKKNSKIGGVTLDVVLNAIPYAGYIKTAYDLYKAAMSKPDIKKTDTWLDNLDIDDYTSKIIDDTVENGFINYMFQTFNSEPDDKPLEQDFNMNQKLIDYLKNNYNNRTITGIQ